jgi:uncharacterized protein (TIGR01777 family)
MSTRDSNREIVVTGATGLVGRCLVPRLREKFEVVRILSRSARSSDDSTRYFVWDGIHPPIESVSGAHAIIHLAGEPIFGGLPTADRRARIEHSRVDSTRAIVDGLAEVDPESRPRTLICASAVGYYGDRGDEWLEEDTAPGTGFLADVCRNWEAEAARAESLGVRVVRPRIGVVVSREGGALALMKLPFSLGLGGRLGEGRQFFPWVHVDDLVGVLLWALETAASGPVNAVAPEAIRNIELTRALGQVLRRPTILPLPGFALRLALGELSGELLGSRRVRPRRLEEAGFEYAYPTLRSALEAEFG